MAAGVPALFATVEAWRGQAAANVGGRPREPEAPGLFSGVVAWQDALPTPTHHGNGRCFCLMRMAAQQRDIFDRVSVERGSQAATAAPGGTVSERKRGVGAHNIGKGKCCKLVMNSSGSTGRARTDSGSRPARRATRTAEREAFIRRSVTELRALRLCWQGVAQLVGVSLQTIYRPLDRYGGRALIDVLRLRTLPKGACSRAARQLVPISALASHRCCSERCLASVGSGQRRGGQHAYLASVWAQWCATPTDGDTRGQWQRQSDILGRLLWVAMFILGPNSPPRDAVCGLLTAAQHLSTIASADPGRWTEEKRENGARYS